MRNILLIIVLIVATSCSLLRRNDGLLISNYFKDDNVKIEITNYYSSDISYGCFCTRIDSNGFLMKTHYYVHSDTLVLNYNQTYDFRESGIRTSPDIPFMGNDGYSIEYSDNFIEEFKIENISSNKLKYVRMISLVSIDKSQHISIDTTLLINKI